MSFRYFAYGSNLWLPQMRSRCSSARPIGPAAIEGWRLVCDKPSTDGSAKYNIRPEPDGRTHGVIYEIDDSERTALDRAEPLYEPIEVDADPGGGVLTYSYGGDPSPRPAYDWYLEMALAGAAQHGVPDDDHRVDVEPDPIAAGIRPADRGDLTLMQSIVSEGLAAETDRYYVHPGDLAWWEYHGDARYPDRWSLWVQEDEGLMVLDSREPFEIVVFTRPGSDRMGLIRWAQRRFDDRGEVAYVSDSDTQLVEALGADGYEPVHVDRSYEWDLTSPLPEPKLPTGWELRPVAGEHEANSRRAASHAAFESTMPEAMHLQRYLDFMRSPVYVPENDLVAVSPDGTIVSFMVWWPDQSGIAQIEPFGTHPDFHRQGIGRALLYFGLQRMKAAGMRLCRVMTDDYRDATDFYEGVGFSDVGRLRWWKPVRS